MAWTEEQKKAASERTKARWAARRSVDPAPPRAAPLARKAETDNDGIEDEEAIAASLEALTLTGPPVVPTTSEPKQGPTEKQPDTVTGQDYSDLLKEVEELKRLVANSTKGLENNPSQTLSLKNGRLIGTFEKYNINGDYYPDPRERLAKEGRLNRFAFGENYELNWDVGVSEYTTIDDVRTREPKFTLELVRKMYDEDSGELTNGRYIVCRLIMHEDPEAALVIAREQDLDVDESAEEQFLNEMRYIRMKDWLLECFYPAPVSPQGKRKEMVIGGKLVEYYENTVQSAKRDIPFDKLKDHKL